MNIYLNIQLTEIIYQLTILIKKNTTFSGVFMYCKIKEIKISQHIL